MRQFTPLLRLSFCGLFFFLAAFAAQAQTIFITPSGAGDQSGSSWTNAAPGTQLQKKISGAASGSQVWVAGGTYQPASSTAFSMKEGVKIYGSFGGSEATLSQRTLSITASKSVLQGNGSSVVRNSRNGLSNAAVLDGFTITGGTGSPFLFGANTYIAGGGILLESVSPVISNCIVNNNYSPNGGAVYSNSSYPVFNNCVFSNNTTTDNGFAIFIQYGHDYLNNCTLYGNSGFNVIDPNFGDVTVSNCIIWGNSARYVAIVTNGGGNATVSNSIIQSGFSGSGNLNADPLFVDAANGNYRLKPNSPAIDKGDNAANSIPTDLDGNPRIVNGIIDMGAYEFQCAPTILTGQPQNTSGCTGGTATFTVAVTGPGLTYKWYKDGQAARSGSNSSRLTIYNLTAADAGSYTVDIISDCGTVTTNAATLTVNSKPVLTMPGNITVSSGETTCSASVSFAATATGTPAPSITYKIGGTPVSSPYTFPEGTTTVTAVATNTCGTESKTFTVTVQDKTPPVFTAPANQDISLGANCSLTIPDLTSGLVGSDNCSNVVTFTQLPVAGTIVNSGHNQTQVVTITADDGHGNTTSHTVTLTAKDNTLPTTTAPAAITVSTDAGICSASHVALGTPITSDNCTVASVSNNAPSVFPKGTTTVTWTATDAAGNQSTATQTVTVSDNEKPVITCPVAPVTSCYDASGTYTIPTLSATDNCGTTNTAYTISGATTRNGMGNNASGQFNNGTSTIIWTVTDGSNNQSTCQTTVVINTPVTVSIADVKVLSSGVNVNTVYVGYSPAATATLTATVSGGSSSYTYQWSTGATTATIKVSPTVTTTYTVTIRDAKGCTATATKQIKVINASCGSKVNVCHGGNTLCIDKTSVPDHLGHGDYLGACNAVNSITMAAKNNMVAEPKVTLNLNASPNPSSNYFTLHINGNATGKVVLTILDAVGRVVKKREMAVGQAYQVGTSYRPGVYFVQATQGNKTATIKLIKQAW